MIFRRRPTQLFAATRIPPFIKIQNRNLVNVKFKWVKDPVLDTAVSNALHLKAASTLISLIASNPDFALPIYCLSRCRSQLGLPPDLKLSTFIRRYPNIFREFYRPDSSGTPVPWYELTSEASEIHHQETCLVYNGCYADILSRLQKLLMLTKQRLLPLQTIDQLRWDLGLPYDYETTLVAERPDLFSSVKLPDDRVGVKLLTWDKHLAVSHLESKDPARDCKALAFPIRFTRGFGLKRKCMQWLDEWQKLPYTSPYADWSHLDPRTDESEKRVVGVFHELLHLTVLGRTERRNLSNLRGPLGMPQKFTKVFERHPGIFYLSRKGGVQTVVLREAYDREGLMVERHPLGEIREKYACMMRKGFLDRSRGLYRRERGICEGGEWSAGFVESENEMEHDLLSEYESD
ncbi:Ubiquitin carboxyl-terminal hydrolase family protein [Striga hermonthica]|uniref:Ubiquitin carboxyl-terminal hydrolase family protein n=1 Tax=Striga hermonthica TaxID=68872 RepID=A0A9N7MSQ9_STRHE|nr:Ubiquitin carboxyl-terminal hydrolase family protein [Striga hermonthica]